MNVTILLLAPSRGLGGGIERYVSTIEAALRDQRIPYRRLDLIGDDRATGLRRKLRFVWQVRRAVRASRLPVRLVIAHVHLLPAVRLVAAERAFAGATVILHGREIWHGRRVRGHRLLLRPDVRAVAVSNYSAGAVLGSSCPARVLPPGVAAPWYDLLVRAGDRTPPRLPERSELHLVTAFRLADWRDKGLDTVIRAVDLLGDRRIRLTVCGSGPVPSRLRALLATRPWCRLAPDLTDAALAEQFARADLFVLATRTRTGSDAYGEGFGMVLLEAQLAGTPVIAPAFGGSGDAFQPERTGLSPIDETPAALAAVLAELAGDAARRVAMGRAAAAWSREQFAPDVHHRRVVRALLGLTGGDTPESSPVPPGPVRAADSGPDRR
jgi:phosphatidyl-myo-inositol dimannoside synthase